MQAIIEVLRKQITKSFEANPLQKQDSFNTDSSQIKTEEEESFTSSHDTYEDQSKLTVVAKTEDGFSNPNLGLTPSELASANDVRNLFVEEKLFMSKNVRAEYE